MRGSSTPFVAAVLAVGWLTACVFDCAVLAAITAGLTISAICCFAPRRLRPAQHLLAVGAVGAFTAIVLLVLAVGELSPAAGFFLQLGYAAVLFPALPALYAATFPNRDRRRDDP